MPRKTDPSRIEILRVTDQQERKLSDLHRVWINGYPAEDARDVVRQVREALLRVLKRAGWRS